MGEKHRAPSAPYTGGDGPVTAPCAVSVRAHRGSPGSVHLGRRRDRRAGPDPGAERFLQGPRCESRPSCESLGEPGAGRSRPRPPSPEGREAASTSGPCCRPGPEHPCSACPGPARCGAAGRGPWHPLGRARRAERPVRGRGRAQRSRGAAQSSRPRCALPRTCGLRPSPRPGTGPAEGPWRCPLPAPGRCRVSAPSRPCP